MEIKKEYAVFIGERHGSDVYYYDFNTNKHSNEYKKLGGYSYIPCIPKFGSLADAEVYLGKLKTSKVCRPNSVYVIDETNELAIIKAITHAMWDKKNEYDEVAFICRVPDEYYLGSKWCETLKYMGDTRYSDEKPYQLRGTDTSDILAASKWLAYNSPEDFRWVDDRFEASFFGENEAKRVHKIVNDIRANEIPYKGYVGLEMLPLRIENEQPKFQKGDKAFILGCERLRNSLRYPAYEGEIADIMVEFDEYGKKRYVYAFSNNPYADKFIVTRYFHTEGELVLKGGKFHYGMHNGYSNTKLLDLENREYVVY